MGSRRIEPSAGTASPMISPSYSVVKDILGCGWVCLSKNEFADAAPCEQVLVLLRFCWAPFPADLLRLLTSCLVPAHRLPNLSRFKLDTFDPLDSIRNAVCLCAGLPEVDGILLVLLVLSIATAQPRQPTGKQICLS